ncbi:hypothetical protein R5W23_003216 [Gemmata sp. JC673]|uniref:Cytochrome P460 domain-containing protein n=1 Tax=Gemmata algarum TaxID=2975278 RepID=A0ABU5F3S0_9BACT|nr:hypothetical protein [Gemmata algarum]MDY3561788.1 hypothetical protein [Gemmata algarum]
MNLLAAVIGCGPAPVSTTAPVESPRPVAASDAQPPTELVFAEPEKGTEEDRAVLNQFSWRDFIALNWPAAAQRGVADTTKNLGDPAERVVWESWKSVDELFSADPIRNPPTDWDSYKATLSIRFLDRDKKQQHHSAPNGLPAQETGKVKLLQQLARLEDVNHNLLDVNQAVLATAKGSPLVAQNKTFVRFETRMNREAYDFMKQGEYYIKEKQPAKLTFPNQAIHIKAAWMELPEQGTPAQTEALRKRFYSTTAKLIEWTDEPNPRPILKDRVVGLVGLHIVHKTPGRPDWIWSTFEHRDNLLPERGPGTPPASFSRKDPAPAAAEHNKPQLDPLEPRKPLPQIKDEHVTEVVRVQKIHETTADVNKDIWSKAPVRGTVWENYQLIGTQWPKFGLRTRPTDGGSAENRLPKNLANVTMETFFPANRMSCLQCHISAAPGEFVFHPERAVSVPQVTKKP